jgi:exo-beta-1,3-glucanase (GH17 family)
MRRFDGKYVKVNELTKEIVIMTDEEVRIYGYKSAESVLEAMGYVIKDNRIKINQGFYKVDKFTLKNGIFFRILLKLDS